MLPDCSGLARPVHTLRSAFEATIGGAVEHATTRRGTYVESSTRPRIFFKMDGTTLWHVF
jgi:hypothetical protein